jgi:hypothetical protein
LAARNRDRCGVLTRSLVPPLILARGRHICLGRHRNQHVSVSESGERPRCSQRQSQVGEGWLRVRSPFRCTLAPNVVIVANRITDTTTPMLVRLLMASPSLFTGLFVLARGENSEWGAYG